MLNRNCKIKANMYNKPSLLLLKRNKLKIENKSYGSVFRVQ